MRRDRQSTFTGLSDKPVATLDEACEAYGLNREVEKRSLYYPAKGESEGDLLESPFHCQTVDVETNQPLGVVGKDIYEVVPYVKAFCFAEPLIENGARIIAGGAPHFGEKAYLVLENPGSFKVGNHEILNRYTLRSSHDGSTKIECRSTPYFTANRIAMTIDASAPLSFKHTPNVGNRLAQARTVFKRVNENWNQFTAGIQKMIATPLSDPDARAFIEQITPSKAESKRVQNIRDEIYTLFKLTGQARHVAQCKGTLFGLVQAVGEWADYHRTQRKSKNKDEVAATLDARIVNDAAKKKQKSWSMALWMMNNKKLAGASLGGE